MLVDFNKQQKARKKCAFIASPGIEYLRIKKFICYVRGEFAYESPFLKKCRSQSRNCRIVTLSAPSSQRQKVGGAVRKSNRVRRGHLNVVFSRSIFLLVNNSTRVTSVIHVLHRRRNTTLSIIQLDRLGARAPWCKRERIQCCFFVSVKVQ